MIDRRVALLSGAAVLGTVLTGEMTRFAVAQTAGGIQPYTQAAFDAAQKADKPILIDTYATWCDICARQAPILEKLVNEPRFKDLVVFRVNFDTQKDIMRTFNARLQSTLIAFHGSKEVGRSVGETQPEWVDDLVSKTLGKATS